MSAGIRRQMRDGKDAVSVTCRDSFNARQACRTVNDLTRHLYIRQGAAYRRPSNPSGKAARFNPHQHIARPTMRVPNSIHPGYL